MALLSYGTVYRLKEDKAARFRERIGKLIGLPDADLFALVRHPQHVLDNKRIFSEEKASLVIL